MKKTSTVTTIQPLGNRVLISSPPPEPTETQMVGELYLPEAAANAIRAKHAATHREAEVLAIGESCKTAVKPGSRIVYPIANPYAYPVKIDGETHWFISEESIIAIVG